MADNASVIKCCHCSHISNDMECVCDLVRPTVGQQVDGLSGGVGEGEAQRRQRVGAALALEALHPLPGALQVLLVHLLQLRLPRVGAAVERHQVELLLVTQLFLELIAPKWEHVLYRVLLCFDLELCLMARIE